MSIYNILLEANIPVAYNKFEAVIEPPFIVYMGTGQNKFEADNGYYIRQNTYQIEYYYHIKDEDKEKTLEDILLAHGLKYEKSDDNYIQSDDMYVIYYNV